jgi:hypothetical protein
MTDTQAEFTTWLSELLSDRKQLCGLLAERQRAKIVADLRAVKATEDAICALVLDPLNLCRRDAPNPAILVLAVAALPSRFCAVPYGSPERVLDNLVPGFSLCLGPALRERLLDLCGCLDDVIARKQLIQTAEVEVPTAPQTVKASKKSPKAA